MSPPARWPARAILAVATYALAPDTRAQDFALPRVTPLDAPAAPLEDALPRAGTRLQVVAGTISWYGVPGLVTRAISADLGWRVLRGAVGVSQTGDPELGWTTLALGLGAAGADWGAGVRALARRDRTRSFGWDTAPGEGGVEVGAGAWLVLGHDCTAWASAPSLASTGAEPPLARPLEAGIAWHGPGLTLWLAHRSSPAGYGGPSLAAGVVAENGPARVWLDAHDAPLAGAMGVAVVIRPLTALAEVESHPWLPPLARLAIVLRGAPP